MTNTGYVRRVCRRFNRDIVECKVCLLPARNGMLSDLIETLWNVKHTRSTGLLIIIFDLIGVRI